MDSRRIPASRAVCVCRWWAAALWPAWALCWLPFSVLSAGAQITECPTTVAPGGWLLEMDVAVVAQDRHTTQRDGWHYRSTTLGAALFSTGVTPKLDCQFGWDLWREERGSRAGITEVGRGQGDGWLRAKWNFAGDESEGPAWAVLPYVKLPLADEAVGNGRTEPGLALVYGRPAGTRGAFNAMLGVDWLDDGGDGRVANWYGSAVRTWDCGSGRAVYAEIVTFVDSRATGQWSGEVGAGFTWATRRGLMVDLVLYGGITRSAPDWTPVLRFSWPL